MDHHELSRHLLLTAEIALCNEVYAEEAMRDAPNRDFMEGWATRMHKKAAELLALARFRPIHLHEAGVKDAQAITISDIWDGRKD